MTEAAVQPNTQNLIKWCDMHWADLMFALHDLGLKDNIAADMDALTTKMQAGHRDPSFDAFRSINIAAIEVFGIDKILKEHNGCSCCAFANIAAHTASIVASKFTETADG